MYAEIGYPLEVYRELEPLCDKGHVMLVQNTEDGQLYVKKRVQSYAPELYRQLLQEPAEHTPVMYGVYEDLDTKPESPGAVPLIIIEEYISGHTLEEYLRDRGRLTEEDCFRVGLQLSETLIDLHGRKPAIIHRDIKPSNVMLQPDGTVVLLDFSAAKNAAASGRRDTVLIGTAGFAAPEQYGFSVSTAQTDIYSMGVLLNTLRTGSLPWEEQTGGRLKHVVERCLKIDPKDRYADAREFQTALKQARREKCPWLPPGFRTLRWYKMIPAIAWYAFAVFVTCVACSNDEQLLADRVNMAVCGVLGWLLPTLFYGNYLGVRRFFPLMRSRSRWLRLLGFLISPIWLWLLICLAVATVNVLLR